MIGAFSSFFGKRRCSPCLSAIVAVLLVTLSMNGAASAGAERMALERVAAPDEVGSGDAAASFERLFAIAPVAMERLFVLSPLTAGAADLGQGATNARLSAVRVADFPLSSLSRGPPASRF